MKTQWMMLAATVMLAAGCQSPARHRCAAIMIFDSNERIDAQRIVKRRLLLADPVERKAENALTGHPLIASPRLAITFSWCGVDGYSDAAPLPFHAVMTLRKPMSDAEVTKAVSDAFEAAGCTRNAWDWEVAQEGNACAISGFVRPVADVNPNLSGIKPR